MVALLPISAPRRLRLGGMNEPESGSRGDHIVHVGQSASRPIEIPDWPFIVLGVLVVARAAIFVLALFVEPWAAAPGRMVPPWAAISQAALFIALAFVPIPVRPIGSARVGPGRLHSRRRCDFARGVRP